MPWRTPSNMKTLALIMLIVVALVASGGWIFSWRAGRLKEAALIRYQLEAKQAIAEANKATATANEQTAAAKTEQGAAGNTGIRCAVFSPAGSQHLVWRRRQGEREFRVGHSICLER